MKETMNHETIKKICALTAKEIRLISELGPVAEEAGKLAEDVGNAYVFKIGQTTVDLQDAGTLTRDGVWQISIDSGESVQVECTEEGIFKILREEYLIKNGYIEATEGKRLTVGAFRRFANHTQKMLDQSELKPIPIGAANGELTNNIHVEGAGIPAATVTSRRIFPSGQNGETTEIPALMQKTGETVDGQKDNQTIYPPGFLDAYFIGELNQLYPETAGIPNPEDNPGGEEHVFYTSH